MSSNINADAAEKQRLLETNDGLKRATMLLEFMHKDIQLLELKREIQSKVHSDIDQQQRDYFLRQQMKVLQDELGSETGDQELDALKMRAKKKKWPADVAKQFEKELGKISFLVHAPGKTFMKTSKETNRKKSLTTYNY